MGFAEAKGIESRFAGYVEGLVSVIGHADRAGPLHDYLLGLVLPGERKSVEPIAAITAPERTAAQHQSLLPLRPERHIPNSIATMRRRLINAIVTRLSRCPCCGRDPSRAILA